MVKRTTIKKASKLNLRDKKGEEINCVYKSGTLGKEDKGWVCQKTDKRGWG